MGWAHDNDPVRATVENDEDARIEEALDMVHRLSMAISIFKSNRLLDPDRAMAALRRAREYVASAAAAVEHLRR